MNNRDKPLGFNDFTRTFPRGRQYKVFHALFELEAEHAVEDEPLTEWNGETKFSVSQIIKKTNLNRARVQGILAQLQSKHLVINYMEKTQVVGGEQVRVFWELTDYAVEVFNALETIKKAFNEEVIEPYYRKVPL